MLKHFYELILSKDGRKINQGYLNVSQIFTFTFTLINITITLNNTLTFTNQCSCLVLCGCHKELGE